MSRDIMRCVFCCNVCIRVLRFTFGVVCGCDGGEKVSIRSRRLLLGLSDGRDEEKRGMSKR